MKKKRVLLNIVLLLILIAFGCNANAQGLNLEIYKLNINTPTLRKGYTISAFNGHIRVGIFPEVLAVETDVVLKNFKDPEQVLPLPGDKNIISNIYEFDIFNKAAFKNKKPLIIEIKYNKETNNLKKIYYFDKGRQKWIELPSKTIPERKVVRAVIHLPYARLAVFEEPDIMEEGVASWYRYKNCNCAASPDYPKGTKLRVINLEDKSKPSVIVTVNDWGPDRSVHPDRVIDLDLVAFKKIARKCMGLVKVKVEKI